MSAELRKGEPGSRCPDSRPGKPVRPAQHHGACSLCWAGMSERQRRAAEFEHGPSATVHERFDAYYLATRGLAA